MKEAMDTHNETDLELSMTSTNKRDLFKKPRKPTRQPFAVASDETLTECALEKSVTCSKSLFKKKSKLADDLFNVSFNETNANISENDTLVRSSVGEHEGSKNLMNKSNPFKKKKSEINDSLEKEHSIQVSASEDVEKSVGNLEKLGENFTLEKSSDPEDLELTKYITKPNPFIKKSKSHQEQSMQVSAMEEEEKSMVNSFGGSLDVEDVEPTKFIKKINPFKKNKSNKVHSMQISVAEGDSMMNNFSPDKSTDGNVKMKNLFRRSNKENGSFKWEELQVSAEDEVADDLDDSDGGDDENNDYYGDHDDYNESSVDEADGEDEMEKVMGRKSDVSWKIEKAEKSLPIDKGIPEQSNISSISEIYLNQSSFNDENLNVEMSDHSDEDMPPPSIPPVRPSITTEKPQEDKVTSATDPSPAMNWEEKFKEIVSKSKKGSQTQVEKKPEPAKIGAKKEKPPKEVNKYKPMKLRKPAPFATKRLYRHIIKKLEPKYGIDTLLEAEQIVFTICDTVKKVSRRKTHQKKLIQDLKKELASLGLIETTMDFYEFVIGFLPYPFRVKVVPCLQTRTNTVFPPKDVGNPFDKIL